MEILKQINIYSKLILEYSEIFTYYLNVISLARTFYNWIANDNVSIRLILSVGYFLVVPNDYDYVVIIFTISAGTLWLMLILQMFL